MTPDLDNVLADAGWIRALARQLVRDGAAADDLVQETWVAALERPPRASVPFRSWGSAVMRNLARQRRRGELRRAARERAAEVERFEPSPESRLERLETHRIVVAAVRELEEPYRDVILARYFEGSSPAAIARRLGVPVRTVHSHLHRGRARLREKLARRLGGEAWSLALLALSVSPRRLSLSLSTGALLVSTKLKLAAATAVVLSLGGAAYWLRDPGIARPTEPGLPARVPAPAEELAALVPSPVAARRTVRGEERAPLGAVAAAADQAAGDEPVLGSLNGRVIDAEGRPVAGVNVRLRAHGGDDVAQTLTDGTGHYRIRTAHPEGRLEVVDDAWITILNGMVWAGVGSGDEWTLVVARPRRLTGHVVDSSGTPVPDAGVELLLPPDFRSALGEVLVHANEPRWRTEVDELGRFELPAAPDVAGCRLFAERGGFRNPSIECPRGDALGLELVLSPGREESIVRGTVVDGSGQPVEDAYVGLHFSAARTLADGSFTIREPAQGAELLWAAKAGRLPASARRAVGADGEPGPWPDPLVLVLDGEPLRIEGRVVDERGEPLADIAVWTDDRTPFGAVADEQFGATMTFGADVESLLAGRLHHDRSKTDPDGRFVLEGLLDKPYRLTILERGTLRSITTDPVPAGRLGMEIVLPALEPLPPVAGRVLGLDGAPIPRLLVEPWLRLDENGFPAIRGNGVLTDEEGRFELGGLSVLPGGLCISGPAVGMGTVEPLTPKDDATDLEYRLPQRVHFRLALRSHDVDRGELRDADDAALSVVTSRGNLAYEAKDFAIQEGRTEAMSADERARWLVLWAGDREVRRVPVRFVAGELNVVDG